MGKVDHLQVQLLSALADGELDLSAARNAQSHLAQCQACAAQLAAFARLDGSLATPAPISCASSRELRSALVDRELSAGEAAVATAHLSSCGSCGAEQAVWVAAEASLRRMPAAFPSAALDARIARLTAPAARRSRFPLAPTGVGALAMRGAVAAAVVLAILVGLLPAGVGPEVAQEAPAQDQAIVASVQQFVLYPPTNTLYLLQAADEAVDAVDASTYALRTRIAIGGRPSALALNVPESRVLVLVSSSKSVIEIDAERNTVISTTVVPVTGTPTSLQVDAATGKIVVAAVVNTGGDGGARPPSPTPGQSTGEVAVIDSGTKKLDIVRTTTVAPRLVVSDREGKGTLLVSPSATTLVDKTYQPLLALPGGVSAAFGAAGRIAVLAKDASNAILYLIGDGAPVPQRLTGIPRAVTGVPDGGFAVLLGSGSGNGRVVIVDEAGRTISTVDVDQAARDLVLDEATGRLTVVGDGRVVASVPAPVAAKRPEATETRAPSSATPSSAPASASPIPPSSSPSIAPSSSPSSSPAVSVSPSPSASAPVAAAPSAAPLPYGVPLGAREVASDLYRLSLGGSVPVLTAANPTTLWILDQRNMLMSFEIATGARGQTAQLPADARITTIAAGRESVFALDPNGQRLFTFRYREGVVSSRKIPLFQLIVAIAPGRDDVLWMTMSGSSQLLNLDPRTGRIQIVDIGIFGASQLAVDGTGAVWMTDNDHVLGRFDLDSGRFTQLAFDGSGRIGPVMSDASGSVWVGTSAGEVYQYTAAVSRLVQRGKRPVAALALDPIGRVWYLAPADGQPGFAYAPADGSRGPQFLQGPITGLIFSPAWRAWLTDASGGIWVSLESPR